MNRPRRSSVLRAKSPSMGGNSATGHSDSGGGGGVSATKTSSKKYKFHPDYAQAVLGDERKTQKNGSSARPQRRHVKQHPFEDNDEFWQKKYKIINYRKKYPKDYDENLFSTLYDWITNGDKRDLNDGRGENILFKESGAPKIGAKIKPRIVKLPKDNSETTTLALDPTRKMQKMESPRNENETKMRRSRSTEGLRPSESEPNFSSKSVEIRKVAESEKIQRRRSSSMNKKIPKKI